MEEIFPVTNLVPDHAQILEARIARAAQRPDAAQAPFDRWPLLQLLARHEGGQLIPRSIEDPAYAAHFAYTDRESYLAWVAAWKEAYRALSLAQRERKAARRAAGSSVPAQIWWDLYDGAHQAWAMLALRAAAKRDSWAKRCALLSSAASS
jgi:hypothetical protein